MGDPDESLIRFQSSPLSLSHYSLRSAGTWRAFREMTGGQVKVAHNSLVGLDMPVLGVLSQLYQRC